MFYWKHWLLEVVHFGVLISKHGDLIASRMNSNAEMKPNETLCVMASLPDRVLSRWHAHSDHFLPETTLFLRVLCMDESKSWTFQRKTVYEFILLCYYLDKFRHSLVVSRETFSLCLLSSFSFILWTGELDECAKHEQSLLLRQSLMDSTKPWSPGLHTRLWNFIKTRWAIHDKGQEVEVRRSKCHFSDSQLEFVIFQIVNLNLSFFR